MRSCVALLTFRRLPVLQKFLASIEANVPRGVPVAIFEDCANADDTYGFLTKGGTYKGVDEELDSFVYDHGTWVAYLGRRNQGVSGNSNKAIRWFERQPALDHLLLCNDDLEATGDFTQEYAAAHEGLKIGLFSFCDFTIPEYVGPKVKVMGFDLRIVSRMTGMMMSMTRAVVERIGYFDVVFWRFGQEHCDFQNRARFCQFSNVRGSPVQQVDLVSKTLVSQKTESSIAANERPLLDRISGEAIRAASARYTSETWYRPFRLLHGAMACGYDGEGIPIRVLENVGYPLLVAHTSEGAVPAGI